MAKLDIKDAYYSIPIYEFQIQNLLKKGVIRNSSHEPGAFISQIFLRKSDGGYRLILNLKKPNESVEYRKLKMETLATTIQLIRPNMYMAKLDIKDAYHSIPIYESEKVMVAIISFLIKKNQMSQLNIES